MTYEPLSRGRRALRATTWTLALSLLAGALGACYLREVDGDRATTMSCPEGEVCSEHTPEGLSFVGAFLFDNPTLRLGPVIAGGTFDLGLRAPAGVELPDYAIEIEDPSLMRAERGEGVFGPVSDYSGDPLYPVDGYLTLTGLGRGETMIRIVDPDTGELYDRLPLEVVAIDDIAIVNMNDAERTTLYAGEDELLGIRLVADNGSRQMRAIDQSLEFHAEGDVQPELMYWDCFTYTVPSDQSEVTFEIVAAGRTFTRTLSIVEAPAPMPDR